MNPKTINRFCVESGIEESEVSLEALKLLRGEGKDHLKAHNDLKKFYLIRDAAKKNQKTLSDVLNWLNQD